MNLEDALGSSGGTAPIWVSGATVAQWSVVRSPTDFLLYIRKTATGSGATDPTSDTTNYTPAGLRVVKSIQRGTFSGISPSTTATLSPAVNPAKTELRFYGMADQGGTITNSTTLTFTRPAGSISGNWEITEFY